MLESITHLPINILVEILSRLPLKSLFACWCTCKSFANLISRNPEFIAAYSLNATAVLLLKFQGSNVHEFLKPCLHLIEPEFDFPSGTGSDRDDIPAIHIPYMEVYNLNLVNSCNGLLYLAREYGLEKDSIVCNPVTNEYITIPEVDQWGVHYFSCLGFCPGTNQYKVLNVFIDIDVSLFRAKVTVVGSNLWVDVGGLFDFEDALIDVGGSFDFEDALIDVDVSRHALLNGVIYWSSVFGILCFYFELEKFVLIPLPSEIEVMGSEYGDHLIGKLLNIGLLGESLCLTFLDPGHRVDLWVMEGNGNQEGWIKKFVVNIPSIGWQMEISPVQPLQVLKNGEILLLFDNDLACYDPSTDGFRYVMAGQLCPGLPLHVVSLVPSFVSLKDILKVDDAIISRNLSGDPMGSEYLNTFYGRFLQYFLLYRELRNVHFMQ